MLLRLDKFLTEMCSVTRKEAKQYISRGKITVNNTVVKSGDLKIDTDKDEVFMDGQRLSYVKYEYYILNKPAGYVSSTDEKDGKTALSLIKTAVRNDLFIVGRLDKDTEGLLFITNDGELCHRLLSPKKHVDKKYYAIVDGKLSDEDVEAFSEGIDINGEYVTKPAKLEIIKSDNNESEVYVTISEGKYHQIKRMMQHRGVNVTYLKRLSMGTLCLGELGIGEYRKLTDEERNALNVEENN